MNQKEVEQIATYVERLVSEVSIAFSAKNNGAVLPKQALYDLTKQYTDIFTDLVIAARAAEVDQAEATLTDTKKSSWDAFKADRKAAVTETNKQLGKWRTKKKETGYKLPMKELS